MSLANKKLWKSFTKTSFLEKLCQNKLFRKALPK